MYTYNKNVQILGFVEWTQFIASGMEPIIFGGIMASENGVGIIVLHIGG